MPATADPFYVGFHAGRRTTGTSRVRLPEYFPCI